jgi:hypothetical protein
LEEAEVIEEASRRAGKVPAQFIKDAGLSLALAVLDGQGRGQGRGQGKEGIYCISDIRWK